MDTRTLILINVMLYALYAGVTLANARIFGGSRGARWFAGANISRAGAMLMALMLDWPRVPLRVVEALTGLFAVAWLMMLHWSFVELLERGPLLRRVQLGLAGAMVAAAVYVLIWPPDAPVLVGVMCLVERQEAGGRPDVERAAAPAPFISIFTAKDVRLEHLMQNDETSPGMPAVGIGCEICGKPAVVHAPRVRCEAHKV